MNALHSQAQGVRARWAIAAIFLVNGFLIGSWAPHIPLVMARLAISEFTLGLLILCFGLGALVSMPWCGWLMARFGQTAVLRSVGLLQGFGLLIVVLSPNVPSVAVTMMLFGALVGCTDVAMNAATVTVERLLKSAVMSSMHGFWSLGGFVGGGLGGLVVQGFGPTAHALGVAVVAVGVAAAAVPFLLPEMSLPAPDAPSKPKAGFSLPRSPHVYLLGLMAMLLFASEGAVLDWGALYMSQERGADLATAGLAYAFFAGAMAVMRFAGDMVRNRYGAIRTLRVSASVAGLAMLCAAFAPHPALVILAFAVCGLAVANTVPIVFSASGNLSSVSSGAGVSVVSTMGYSGILVAPSLIGFVAERTGFVVVFSAIACVLVAMSLMSGLARPADFNRDLPPSS